MKPLIIFCLAFTFSCSSDSTSNNNNGWTFNNGTTANNGTTPNNRTTRNNGTASNNGISTSGNNGTVSNNGTTSHNNGTTGGGTTGGTTSSVRVPVQHRPIAQACDDVRPKGSGGDPNSQCLVDADCAEGANGRCNFGRGGARCTYDTCFSDDDCGETVCACEPDNVSNIGNRCLATGSCQIDSDCGTGFCSPTFGSCGNYSGNIAYFCHTPEDECIDDSDCADFGNGGAGAAPYCKFSPEAARWICADSQCVG